MYITDESDPQDGKPGETVATMPAGSTWVVWDGTSGSQNYAVFDVSDTGIGKIRPLSEEHRIGRLRMPGRYRQLGRAHPIHRRRQRSRPATG